MRMIDGEAEVVRWTDFDGTLAWRSGSSFSGIWEDTYGTVRP